MTADPALQLWWAAEPGAAEHLAQRLDGARGLRYAVVLDGPSGVSAVLAFESSAMQYAYTAWAPEHLVTTARALPTALSVVRSFALPTSIDYGA
jgi:hypothetical protein